MARFVGGPCDGQTAASAVYTTLTCGGANYSLSEDGNYHYLAAGGAPGTIPGSRDAGSAWHRLMRVLAVETPLRMRKARAHAARARRIVR